MPTTGPASNVSYKELDPKESFGQRAKTVKRLLSTTAVVLILTAMACSARHAVVLGIRESDHDTDFSLPSTTRVALQLPATYDWTIEVADQRVVRLISSSSSSEYMEWGLEAVSSGVTTLRAVGVPKCRLVQPPCDEVDRVFRVGFDVK